VLRRVWLQEIKFKNSLKIVLRVLAVLVISAVGLAGYHGALSKVAISEESLGPFQFVYRPLVSANHQEVARLTSEMDLMLASIDVEHRAPLHVYFPDGSAQIGFQVDGVELDLTLSNGTRVQTISEQDFMIARFPQRSPLSSLVGRMRVDPALAEYQMTNGYTASEVMALYNEKTITYLQPVRKI
jgi:hypothetical protein